MFLARGQAFESDFGHWAELGLMASLTLHTKLASVHNTNRYMLSIASHRPTAVRATLAAIAEGKQAAGSPGVVEHVLDRIREQVQSATACVFAPHRVGEPVATPAWHAPVPGLEYEVGMPQNSFADYNSWVWKMDVWRLAIQKNMAAMAAMAVQGGALSQDLVPVHVLKRTPFYADYLTRRLGGLDHMMCAPLAGGHVLGFSRSALQKAFTMNDLAQVQQFKQPLEDFIQAQLRAERQLNATAHAHAALDRVQDGVLLVDATSAVLTANAAACQYLGLPLAPLREQPSGWAQLLAPPRVRLQLIHPPLWKLALDARYTGQTGVGSISGTGGLRELTVQVAWERPQEAGAQAHLLLRAPGQLNPAQQVQRCARNYRLTDTESRVLAGLIDSTPQEVATALGLKITTVRTHMAAIFVKTGTRRQAELIWVVAGA